MLTCGAALKTSLDWIVQSPSAGCTSRLRALFVVAVRSPISGVMTSEPGLDVRLWVAGFSRTQVHCDPTVEHEKSSLRARCAKLTS